MRESQYKANCKYNKKTYDSTIFNLNTEKDAEIIESIETALLNGKSKRQWLREVYDLVYK